MIWFIKASRKYMSHLTTWQFIKRLPMAMLRYAYYSVFG